MAADNDSPFLTRPPSEIVMGDGTTYVLNRKEFRYDAVGKQQTTRGMEETVVQQLSPEARVRFREALRKYGL